MVLSVQVHNRKKDILVFREGTTDELDDTTVTTEAKCSLKSCLSVRQCGQQFCKIML